MHKVIRTIVYAKTKQEAFENAKSVFDDLCGEDRPFDYYETFEANHSPIAGQARWGKLTPIAEADSKEGKNLIKEGMEATASESKRYLGKCREILATKTDEEIINGSMDTFYFGQVYIRGTNAWLFDFEGEPISDEKHLNGALGDYKENKDDKYWVVPADVHF